MIFQNNRNVSQKERRGRKNMTIKLIATSLDNGLIKTVQARPVAPPNRSFCLEHLPPLLVLEGIALEK